MPLSDRSKAYASITVAACAGGLCAVLAWRRRRGRDCRRRTAATTVVALARKVTSLPPNPFGPLVPLMAQPHINKVVTTCWSQLAQGFVAAARSAAIADPRRRDAP